MKEKEFSPRKKTRKRPIDDVEEGDGQTTTPSLKEEAEVAEVPFSLSPLESPKFLNRQNSKDSLLASRTTTNDSLEFTTPRTPGEIEEKDKTQYKVAGFKDDNAINGVVKDLKKAGLNNGDKNIKNKIEEIVTEGKEKRRKINPLRAL